MITVALALASALPAHAYTVLSPGTASCGQWISDHNYASGTNLHAEESWVAGYLSGYNRFVPGNGNITTSIDSAGWTAWITNYCRDKPLVPIVKAADALIIELKNRR